MIEYSELKRMIEDLVVERDGWKRSCEAANAHWASTRERDEFNRCEAHLRGRKISKLQQELRQAKDDLVEAGRIPEHAAILSLQVERDQLKAENECIERNRDMWKGQVERQAEALASLRKAIIDINGAIEREYWSEYAGLDETRKILDSAMSKEP